MYIIHYTKSQGLGQILNAGFTTDGEFNSLQWRGSDRPLTVL